MSDTETKAELKKRLKAEGKWSAFVDKRDHLKAKGVPPQEAKAQALLAVDTPKQAATEADYDAWSSESFPPEADETLWNESTADSKIIDWLMINIFAIEKRLANAGAEDRSSAEIIRGVFGEIRHLNRIQQLFVSERDADRVAVKN